MDKAEERAIQNSVVVAELRLQGECISQSGTNGRLVEEWNGAGKGKP